MIFRVIENDDFGKALKKQKQNDCFILKKEKKTLYTDMEKERAYL